MQDPLRKSGKGGGLSIYVNKRVCAEEDIVSFCPYNEPGNTSGEFQFIKIKNCKGLRKTIILGNIYRSPSCKPDKFNILYNTVLEKFNNNKYSNKTIYIFGDFNQELIKYDNNINCQNLVDNAGNNGFIQLVARPTRITEHSATLLDLVFTNNIESTLSCNIITIDLTDHLGIHTKITLWSSTRETRTTGPNLTKEHDYRIFNEANNLKFKHLINDETWDGISEDLDAQNAYDVFEEIYLKHYNDAYPLKSNRTRRKNERQNPKPWILPWLEDACARKKRLYHIFVKNPSAENKAKYKKMNDFCQKHVNLAKIKYRKTYFEKYKDDSRKQWEMINSLLNRNRKFNGISRLTDCNGNTANTPSSIASTFNDYFSNIAANLKSSRVDSSEGRNGDENYHQTYLKNSASDYLLLSMVDADEIFNVIKNLKNKSTNDTNISALKIANTSFGFTSAFALIVNKSFHQGHFPEKLKTARVTPIHKEGSKNDVENYRPISILSSFSKIYEKIMHNRLSNFLESNNSIYESQYGFQSGRSCEHTLLNAQNLLLNSLSKQQISLLLLIDFSKAFDMVDHSILVSKLEHYGIRGTVLK